MLKFIKKNVLKLILIPLIGVGLFFLGRVNEGFESNTVKKRTLKHARGNRSKSLKVASNRLYQTGGNKVFNFYNVHHYGDHIWNLKFLYNISKILKDNKIKINYYYDNMYVKNKDELERYVDKDVVTLYNLNNRPNDSIELWMGDIIDNYKHTNSLDIYYVKYYTNILKIMGLNDMNIDRSLFQTEPYLLDIYSRLDPKFKDVDILFINSEPKSGQFDYNKEKFDTLSIQLASKYKLVTTTDVNNDIPCTLRDGLKLQDIGAISTHAKYIIAVFTGPVVATFNTYAKNNVKCWYILDRGNVKLDINMVMINNINELNKIII